MVVVSLLVALWLEGLECRLVAVRLIWSRSDLVVIIVLLLFFGLCLLIFTLTRSISLALLVLRRLEQLGSVFRLRLLATLTFVLRLWCLVVLDAFIHREHGLVVVRKH